MIISLQDKLESESALRGVRLELMDCAFPCLKAVEVSHRLDICLANSNFNFLLSEEPKKPSLTKIDYVKVNA